MANHFGHSNNHNLVMLEGIPDHIKSKFVEMMTKIDNVESIVNGLEKLEADSIQYKVIFIDLAKFD
jgi:hypothetical protein